MGARAEVEFRVNCAPTVNDPQASDFAASVCAELVGADKVDRNPPLIMASEDFSYMLDRVPGCFVNIGNGDGDGDCEVHNPAYDFNDEAIPLGSAFFSRVVERKLSLT
jgi:hippurate hydrolase